MSENRSPSMTTLAMLIPSGGDLIPARETEVNTSLRWLPTLLAVPGRKAETPIWQHLVGMTWFQPVNQRLIRVCGYERASLQEYTGHWCHAMSLYLSDSKWIDWLFNIIRHDSKLIYATIYTLSSQNACYTSEISWTKIGGGWGE